MIRWLSRQWFLIKHRMFLRFVRRSLKGEPYVITEQRPADFASDVPNKFVPNGSWPYTVQIKPYPRPSLWRLECGL